MTDKFEETLLLTEEVLKGLETETLTVSSACLRCSRIAKLINDETSIKWFEYETTGYPLVEGGFIDSEAFEIGCRHGRETASEKKDNRQGFFYLARELEGVIKSNLATMNTLTTQGVSLSGDGIIPTMRDLTMAISARTGVLIGNIRQAEHNLSILNGEYYKYALKVNLELKFSKQAENVFNSYRLMVDKNLIKYAPESLRRLEAAYDNIHSDNPESWSQALASCRRVFVELSDSLFINFIKKTEDGNYLTVSGKVLNVSGANYKNKLYAIVDHISKSNMFLVN